MNNFQSKYLTLFLNFIILVSLSACEDVIDVDLDTAESAIVIDAEILWQRGSDGSRQTITISRITDYYNQEVPKVTGAEVYVENTNGDRFEFQDVGYGVYQCSDFIPELNTDYTLLVVVEGRRYTATETMKSVPEIIDVVQTIEKDFSGEDVIEVQFSYQDPEEETNFYLSDFDTNILFYPEYEITDDDFTNGNILKNEFSDEDLKVGDTIKITHRGISEQFYNYMNLILESTSANPFATPPANIRGNILSEDEEGNSALGYFRLSQSEELIHVIH